MKRLVDPNVLRDLCGNDAAAMRQLLATFSRCFRADLEAFGRAVAEDDRAAGSRLAHKMAGTLLLVGATPIADRLRQVSGMLVDDTEAAKIARGACEVLLGDLMRIFTEVSSLELPTIDI